MIAIAVVSRRVLGMASHVEIGQPRAQEKVGRGDIRAVRATSSEDMADTSTKSVGNDIFIKGRVRDASRLLLE
eukprot:4015757-Pyramimonas_sp.AAC.1